MDGELTCEHARRTDAGRLPAAATVFGIRIEVAGISIYHQGSADLDDSELAKEPVDIFLAGVAGRQVHAALLGANPAEARRGRRRSD
ncbi:MAG: hypothetical protein V9E83_12470, partial [Baekduia sp.]